LTAAAATADYRAQIAEIKENVDLKGIQTGVLAPEFGGKATIVRLRAIREEN